MNKDRIIQQIRQAKSTIKLAIAWFTDLTLIKEFENAARNSIKVEIILSGSEWNLLRFKEFQQLEKLGVKINKFGPHDFTANNFMHHKFMIIDNLLCAHGSRNFTSNANTNREYWQELTSDIKVLKELNFEFEEMKKNLKPVLADISLSNINEIINNLSILENKNVTPIKYHGLVGKSSIILSKDKIPTFLNEVKEEIIYEEKEQLIKKDEPPQNEYGLWN